ncbi:MAG: carboxypeptidase-like regulatory domain-containing protein, partial [Terracidiphilus sp.]
MTVTPLGIRVFRLFGNVRVSTEKAILVLSMFVMIPLLCLTTPSPSLAQAINGSVSGTVKERTGSVLSGAVAVFTNTKTGVETRVITNNDGIYHGFNLQPGTYDLQISAAGFSRGVKTGIVVNVGAQLTVDFVLKVATADQTVSVVGTEAGVDLESTALSYDVTGTTVRELPLNGRDFTSLATLQPSVSTLNGEATSSGSMRSGRGKALTISGNRPAANNFLFDGISM